MKARHWCTPKSWRYVFYRFTLSFILFHSFHPGLNHPLLGASSDQTEWTSGDQEDEDIHSIGMNRDIMSRSLNRIKWKLYLYQNWLLSSCVPGFNKRFRLLWYTNINSKVSNHVSFPDDLWKTLHPSPSDSPSSSGDCLYPPSTSPPSLYDRSRPRLVTSHGSFITSILALLNNQISISPPCSSPSLNDSRWEDSSTL